MPPRKEPKETVVYPASKRKAPAFKPQRPSKVPRIPTTESESSRPKPAAKGKQTPKKAARQRANGSDDEDKSDEDERARTVTVNQESEDSDNDLEDDPLAKPKKPTKSPTAVKKKPPARAKSPHSISSDDEATSYPPPPTQLSDPTQIPQPLLIRLLHEHFADKGTKVDKNAIQVVQKYMEVFVREALARTALQKKEAAERGDVAAGDASWLELEDLEKVAGGMMLDF